MGQEISVAIATRYALDGRIPMGGRDFPDPSRQALGPMQPPIHWVSRLSPEQSDWGVALTIHSHLSPEVKEIIQL